MQLKKRTYRIDPQGNVMFLYDDNSPARKLSGKKTVVRASDVLLGEDEKWHIHLRMGNGHKLMLVDSFEDRRDAIVKEVEVLNMILEREDKILHIDDLFIAKEKGIEKEAG